MHKKVPGSITPDKWQPQSFAEFSWGAEVGEVRRASSGLVSHGEESESVRNHCFGVFLN